MFPGVMILYFYNSIFYNFEKQKHQLHEKEDLMTTNSTEEVICRDRIRNTGR